MAEHFFLKRVLKNFKKKNDSLIASLPKVRGVLLFNEPLSKKNWFGVGGPAEVYFEPADTDDLKVMISNLKSVPITILGAGSNVLIRDGGIPGVTIRLGKSFSTIELIGEDKFRVKAGALVMEISRMAQKNSISGFEFLCGIPGSLGGGIRMNAGAYGSSLFDVLESITVLTKEGHVKEFQKEELFDAFSYRCCHLPSDWIFLEAVLKGKKETDSQIITERMNLNKQKREAGQPKGVRTAGSTFKNPQGLSAWQLIEKSGMKNAKVGGAVVSDKHANFLINTGKATAKDIETLGEKIRQKVFEKEGVSLEWEVKKLGVEDE
ncbi:MAG: UDP-N-acetylmuramate dehydrogenase [Alphaproteobacteria bacterium]|nr:UDP-N-acetylmuramate dehydrogenase [Alphaproteobacteria bacterium]